MYINPEDVIVTAYSRGGSSWSFKPATFISLYQKPTGITTTSEGGGSVHRNKKIAFDKLCAMIVEREEAMCWDSYNQEVLVAVRR